MAMDNKTLDALNALTFAAYEWNIIDTREVQDTAAEGGGDAVAHIITQRAYEERDTNPGAYGALAPLNDAYQAAKKGSTE